MPKLTQTAKLKLLGAVYIGEGKAHHLFNIYAQRLFMGPKYKYNYNAGTSLEEFGSTKNIQGDE